MNIAIIRKLPKKETRVTGADVRARGDPAFARKIPIIADCHVEAPVSGRAGELVLDMFEFVRYHPAMPETPDHRPASPEDVANALAFALRYEGRKRVNHADEMMARITAERLVRHLSASGFVVMKMPAATAPTTSHMPTPLPD
jgi:hypothetical protein